MWDFRGSDNKGLEVVITSEQQQSYAVLSIKTEAGLSVMATVIRSNGLSSVISGDFILE